MHPGYSIEDQRAINDGLSLNQEQLSETEALLNEDKENLKARITIASCFLCGDTLVENGLSHVIWLIEHQPDSSVWEFLLNRHDREYSADLLETIGKHWIEQTERHSVNPSVHGNAGLFFINWNLDLGIQLLEKAIELDPDTLVWPTILATNCFLKVQSNPVSEDNTTNSLITKTLAVCEEFFKSSWCQSQGAQRSPVRAELLLISARMALKLGNLKLARLRAEEYSAILPDSKSGESLLGLVALRESKIDEAKAHLLNFRNYTHICLLDLELADELITSGDTGTVTKYLEACKTLGHWEGLDFDDSVITLKIGAPISLLEKWNTIPNACDCEWDFD